MTAQDRREIAESYELPARVRVALTEELTDPYWNIAFRADPSIPVDWCPRFEGADA